MEGFEPLIPNGLLRFIECFMLIPQRLSMIYVFDTLMVGMEGIEPPRLAALGSKPSVSTSSTTSPKTCYLQKKIKNYNL